MTVPRLKAGIFVRALIRRVGSWRARRPMSHARASEESGAIFLKVSRLDGTSLVLDQAGAAREGELVWVKPLGDSVDEEKARAWFDKQIKFDPDLWIVEIEDRQGRTFVDEPMV